MLRNIHVQGVLSMLRIIHIQDVLSVLRNIHIQVCFVLRDFIFPYAFELRHLWGKW
jgi:hypothetical protein